MFGTETAPNFAQDDIKKIVTREETAGSSASLRMASIFDIARSACAWTASSQPVTFFLLERTKALSRLRLLDEACSTRRQKATK